MNITVVDHVKTFSHIVINHWKKKHNVVLVDNYDDLMLHGSKHDVVYFDWADKKAAQFTENGFTDNCKVIVRIRRYEAFSPKMIGKINWDKVDEVIFNTPYLRALCKKVYGIDKFTDGHIIPNGIDITRWAFRERKKEEALKIAMVNLWNMRKNIPLALQLFALLPKEYELHIAGPWHDIASRVYLNQMLSEFNLKDRVFITDDRVDTNKYLDDKDYLLTTSISEGVSNIVVEAMAKGLMPVVHNGVGQYDLYPTECMFNHIVSCVDIINNNEFNSVMYRDFVNRKYNRAKMLKKMDELL